MPTEQESVLLVTARSFNVIPGGSGLRRKGANQNHQELFYFKPGGYQQYGIATHIAWCLGVSIASEGIKSKRVTLPSAEIRLR